MNLLPSASHKWYQEFDGTNDTLYIIDSNICDIAAINIIWRDGEMVGLSLTTDNGIQKVNIGDYVIRTQKDLIGVARQKYN